jgi:hypothetical protein
VAAISLRLSYNLPACRQVLVHYVKVVFGFTIGFNCYLKIATLKKTNSETGGLKILMLDATRILWRVAE